MIKSRAIDNSGNVQDPPAAVSITVLDTTPPTSIITSPATGGTASTGITVSVTGTASDAGGGSVANVEVSVDGGATWKVATGTTAWSYNWTPVTPGLAPIRSRAVDDSGNQQNPHAEITVTVRLPIRVPSEQPTIQSAIDAANNGDTVLVAPGTYVENINFRGKAITVTSESGPEATIIDGGNADSVVKFISGEGRGSALNGFTLQNGSVYIYSPGIGGGIRIQSSSPTITNNVIRNNQACQGAGIGIDVGSPLIQRNTITGNISPCAVGGGGGGIFIIWEGSPEILDNVISDNVTTAGGGIYMGGGITTPIIKRNVIKGNNVSGGRGPGGGVFMVYDVEALIVQNLITGNQAGAGGGIYSAAANSVIVNNTVADNDGAPEGSGIFAYGYQGLQLTNNIIVAKPGQAAIRCNALGVPSVRFNNIFSAGGPAYAGVCSDMTGRDGNISADPLFTNPAQGDYHLQQGSPSIDSGDNQTLNLPDKDIDGGPRILDGDGNGTATIDMGVDEFLLPPGSTTLISIINSPEQGATVLTGAIVSITGLASAAGGRTVARVEVSVDGGATWNLANGTTAWSYDWTPTTVGSATIKSRAVDSSGNQQNPPAEVIITVRDATQLISAITSPKTGAAVSTGTTVSVTGIASGAGGGSVARVEVSVDGGVTYGVATGTTAWSFNWTPTTTGSATIKSRAVDSSGSQQNPPATVTVAVLDTTSPASIITSPATGDTLSTGTTVSVTGTASDAGGGSVVKVEVSVNGGATWNLASGTTAWSYSWTPITRGPATIKSRAFDDSGNQQDPPTAVSVTVLDATPPTSTITSPKAGAPVLNNQSVTITGVASDAGGGTVAQVDVSVDGGATWSAATGTTAWSYTWTPTTPGVAPIKSRAVDDSGNHQNPPAEITIRVRDPIIIRVPSERLTIQEAIDAADYGDTVLVAPGTYSENIDFRGKTITVRSENGPDVTTIDGGSRNTVVRFTSGEGRDSALNGFTLQNGLEFFDGGGIAVQNSSPTITNNVIRNNRACSGAGIRISFGSPLIQGNTITGNNNTICSGGSGGGISIGGVSSAEILDNVISDNGMGSSRGGGISQFGVGTTPIIKRNIIKGNNSLGEGGGISILAGDGALIVQNLITGNQASSGGGIYCQVGGHPGPILVNNTIADNDATLLDSGIAAIGIDAQTKLINNIIVAKPGQNGFHCFASSNQNLPIIRSNNIFSAGGLAYIGNCSDRTGTDGNISADPQFTNPTQGDYHLQLWSSSIDAGDNQAPDLPDTDIDGDPRILDGDGNGTATIDMGVDEFLLPPGPTSRIRFPTAGGIVLTDATITITGAARNAGGGPVARVDVSVDGGSTWSAATGTTEWSYNWTPITPGLATIKSRAVDDSGNVQDPPAEITVTVRTAITIRVPSDRPTIQDAIDAAEYGDTVRVAPGTYFENINFGGKTITVTSESGPQVTIIDGGSRNSVVRFTSGEGRDSALNGFTLQNGRRFFNTQDSGVGGGIRIESSSPTITNNVIRNNQACEGAGIGISLGSPLIQLNTITGNHNNCNGLGGGIGIRGAASAEILDNVISDNVSRVGAGISMSGAGTPIIKRNIIKGNNTDGGQGGGIYMVEYSAALIVQNLITGNQAFVGGGLYWDVPSTNRGPILVNNTIADNNATSNGSGIYANGIDARTELTNNIIVAKPGQSGLHCGPFVHEQPISRFNNIFSAGGMAYGGSCADMTGTNGNISVDPLFANPTEGDYHLQQGSPSIDAGDNQAPNLPDTDIDENPRILDGDGNGTATIDMGVDEFLLPLGLKISLLDESNSSSKNSRALFICDLRPWARTPGGRPKDPLSALPPRSPRLRVKL